MLVNILLIVIYSWLLLAIAIGVRSQLIDSAILAWSVIILGSAVGGSFLYQFTCVTGIYACETKHQLYFAALIIVSIYIFISTAVSYGIYSLIRRFRNADG